MDRTEIERLRSSLTDARAIAIALGLGHNMQSQTNGVTVPCPWHPDRTPSCSLRLTDHGLVAHCFACGASGDIFTFVAKVSDLDVKTDFVAVIEIAKQLAGNMPVASPPPAPTPERKPLAHYAEIAAFVLRAFPVTDDVEVAAYVKSRGVLAEAIADCWAALPTTASLAPVATDVIAKFGAEAWGTFGLTHADGTVKHASHRLLIPWRGIDGRIVAVQRRAVSNMSPKYVFASRAHITIPYGTDKLADAGPSTDVALVEGAIDALAYRVLSRCHGHRRVVLGLPGTSGWRAEWASLVTGRVVHVATDADEAGDAVAPRIGAECYRAGAVRVLRHRPHDSKDWCELLAKTVTT